MFITNKFKKKEIIFINDINEVKPHRRKVKSNAQFLLFAGMMMDGQVMKSFHSLDYWIFFCCFLFLQFEKSTKEQKKMSSH